MDINELKDICINAVIADSSTLNWCNSNYSNPHTVYEGIDLNNPPPATDYPCINIFPMTKTGGYGQIQKTHIIAMVCGIYDETLTTTTDTNGVTHKKYDGIENIEDFRYLIETAIVTEIESNTSSNLVFIENVTVEYENIEAFPFFLSYSFFEFNEKYSQGDEVFQ